MSVEAGFVPITENVDFVQEIYVEVHSSITEMLIDEDVIPFYVCTAPNPWRKCVFYKERHDWTYNFSVLPSVKTEEVFVTSNAGRRPM